MKGVVADGDTDNRFLDHDELKHSLRWTALANVLANIIRLNIPASIRASILVGILGSQPESIHASALTNVLANTQTSMLAQLAELTYEQSCQKTHQQARCAIPSILANNVSAKMPANLLRDVLAIILTTTTHVATVLSIVPRPYYWSPLEQSYHALWQ